MLSITKQISRYNHTSGRNASIKYIVIHDVGQNNSTAKNNADYFGRNENQQASAHYFVDEKSIYQVVEDADTSWHCGDGRGAYGITNGNSIGIEMIVTNYAISASTINHTIDLVKTLQKKYGIDNAHVVRHYDASRKNCPQYLNKDGKWSGWTAFKAKLAGSSTPTPTPTPAPATGIGANMVNKTTYQRTDTVVNVRTSQTTNSAVVRTLPAGTVFKSGRYADGEDVDGHKYKWFEVDGRGWVYGGLITPTSTPAPTPSLKPIATIAQEVINGKWGNGTDRTAKLKAAGYNPNAVQAEVNKILKGGSTSTPKPAPAPAPSTGGWIAQNGTFTSNTAIKLRTGANTGSGVIATLPAGSSVKYNAYMHSGGYVWIRQPRGNGYGYLATGESKSGKRTSYWGSFK